MSFTATTYSKCKNRQRTTLRSRFQSVSIGRPPLKAGRAQKVNYTTLGRKVNTNQITTNQLRKTNKIANTTYNNKKDTAKHL
jgi:hypothetical protein